MPIHHFMHIVVCETKQKFTQEDHISVDSRKKRVSECSATVNQAHSVINVLHISMMIIDQIPCSLAELPTLGS